MAESAEVLAEDEASYDFLHSYIRSLTEPKTIGRFTGVLLNFVGAADPGQSVHKTTTHL